MQCILKVTKASKCPVKVQTDGIVPDTTYGPVLFICRNSDPKKLTFFTTRPVLLCKNETDKYFSMNSLGFY